ncbi:MAG: elongation factor P-like protein YeiP [Gammaproteobacteria bacterium]|nr:MAG: elongation factor P-like protein YeiP [Gammaproteobacteria bacterium]
MAFLLKQESPVPKANELKSGMVVEINGAPHAVKNVDAKSPSSRGASTLYKVRFTNLKTGQKLDESYKGEDMLKEADCSRVQVQFSYVDGDAYTFMNMEDYSQYTLNRDEIEESVEYLSEGLDGIFALIMDDAILGIELPQSVVLKITETAPGIKGATATGRTKPAILSTGLEIQVPEYLESDQEVKVNTTNAKFMSRA